ncbi:MAG: protein-ADP-ribose hydrolase [Treponema sp.]|nr:protein-ADP-ribose hydrolase [Treponema sp.]
MTQRERREFLIRYLLQEKPEYKDIELPCSDDEQKYLFRSLVNVRPPVSASEEFMRVQDEYLAEENRSRGITDIADLSPLVGDLYLWRGDITTLKVDAIVNAANSGMTGCWHPNHSCIDNCIHTFAGIQLRAVCADIMQKQGHEEPTGQAKITPAFNLPSKYVLHTVGPIISGELTKQDCELLASCYRNCLTLAKEKECQSIAFCCISTGVFRFPADRAAEIAVETVQEWKEENEMSGSRWPNMTQGKMKVVFNVFSEKDEMIYRRVLNERN